MLQFHFRQRMRRVHSGSSYCLMGGFDLMQSSMHPCLCHYRPQSTPVTRLMMQAIPLVSRVASHKGGSASMKSVDSMDRQDTAQVLMESAQNYSKFRQWAIYISTHEDFEFVVLALIVANCITLALFNPLLPKDDPWNDRLGTIGTCLLHDPALHTCAVCATDCWCCTMQLHTASTAHVIIPAGNKCINVV